MHAVICGTELRLVVAAGHVSRVFSLTGLDRLVPIYPSLEAATAASPPTEMLAMVAGPGLGGSRLWGKHCRVWAIATFVSGSAARAGRAGRWSTWLCRSSVVR